MDNFVDYARYYDLFYQDKDYCGEARKVSSLLVKHTKKKIASLLVVGCGTGRHDEAFYNLGYQIYGIDLSAQMIDIAKKRAKSGMMYEVADARNFTSDVIFDACISLFHVMSYQRTNDDIKRAFQSVANALEKDGIFVFDIWYGPGVLRELPSVRVKRVSDTQYDFLRVAEPVIYPNENAVDVYYDIIVTEKNTGASTTIKEIHTMRYYFKLELMEYLQECGLELLECVDCDTLGEATFDSWTIYCVCKKK